MNNLTVVWPQGANNYINFGRLRMRRLKKRLFLNPIQICLGKEIIKENLAYDFFIYLGFININRPIIAKLDKIVIEMEY